MQHLLVIKKTNRRQKYFVIYNIVSIISSPSNKVDKNKVHAINDLLQCSISSEYRRKKGLEKTWTFYFSIPQYRGEMVYQTMNFRTKKVSKALRQKLVEWIMKKSNVHESPISLNTLLITDT